MLFLANEFVVLFEMGDSKVTFLVTGGRFSGAGVGNVPVMVKLESRVDGEELYELETPTLGRI